MSIICQTQRFLLPHKLLSLTRKRSNTTQCINRYLEPAKCERHMLAACDSYTSKKMYHHKSAPTLEHKHQYLLNHSYSGCKSFELDTSYNNTQNDTNILKFNFHSDNRYNYHRNRHFNGKSKRVNYYPMLGLFGLYKGMTASDIEEEKAKLTDEQKMKKMTPAEILIARGVLSMCDQDYIKASELFHEALDLAQKNNDEEQETLILNLLASNYFESGDLKSAEKLFIDLMKRMIAHDAEPTDLAILELSLKLASIYSKNLNTQEKAMKGFKFVIGALLNSLQDVLDSAGELELHEISEERKDELALLGWSYDWFAKHLIAINDYDGAAFMLKRALKISSKVLGPIHDQTLILLNDVGTTMAMNDSPEEGKTYMLKAVEGAIESQSKELASFYVNLGLVNLKLKQLDEAKRYCEYSIELASKNREHQNFDEVLKLSQNCLQEVERLSGVDNK